jgi:hypothetical protein
MGQIRSRVLVVALAVLAPSLAVAQSPSLPSGERAAGETTAGAQPHYPGIPPSQDKAEATVGAFKVRLYGTILFNLSASDAGVFGQELPLWTLPTTGTVTYPDGTVGQSGDNHDLILSMRQSIVGVTVGGTGSKEREWVPSGLVEFDFYGTRPVDTSVPQDRVLTQPRLRLAYMQLEHKSVTVVFGQDHAILAPLDPISLSHVAAPLGATAGDLWAWLPQARVDVTHTIGSTGLLLQAGILRPQFGDPRLETPPTASTSIDVSSSGLGERSTQPFYQARFAISPRIRGNKATLGIAGHYGKEKIGVDSTLSSWAVAFDADVPVDSHIVLRGEAFKGSNLIPFQGGIDQGAALLASATTGAPPLQIQNIHASGGWGEVTVLPTTSGKNAFYVGAGVDNPNVDDLLPGSTRAKNLFIWGSYFRKLTDSVTLSAEWSNWQFETVAFVKNVPSSISSPSKANVIDISLAYQF